MAKSMKVDGARVTLMAVVFLCTQASANAMRDNSEIRSLTDMAKSRTKMALLMSASGSMASLSNGFLDAANMYPVTRTWAAPGDWAGIQVVQKLGATPVTS